MQRYFRFILIIFTICCFKLGQCDFVFRDLCLEKGLCNHPNRSTNFRINSCSCQDNCRYYGDCCRDIAPEIIPVKNVETSCERIFNTNEDVYIANSCPSTWTDENVYLLCKKNVSAEYYNHILDVPFRSNVTNILYANVYCAKCNNDDLFPNKLLVHLQCKPASHNLCNATEMILNSTYIPGELWWQPNTNSINSVRLKVITNSLRKCRRNVIDTCAMNWANSSVMELCEAHANYVERDRKTIYKNIYCAYCNYENIDNLKCVGSLKIHVFSFKGGPSFSALIDFGARNYFSCSSFDEMYDPVTGTCQPTFCGISYVKIRGKCVSKLKKSLMNNATIRSCPLTTADVDNLWFFSNGSVFSNKTLKTYKPNEYERFNSTTYFICDDRNYQFLYAKSFSNSYTIVSLICLFVSLTCLLIHIIIILITHDFSRIPEKNLLNLSLSLFIAQFVFIVGVFNNVTENYTFCHAIAILTHFFYLGVFFWMSIMAYDICRTFTLLQTKSNENRNFCLYFSYAWFTPLIIVIVAIILDQTDIIPSLKPNYGIELCWISNKNALFIFFVLPLALLLIVNIICFILTAYNINQATKAAKIIKKSADHTRFFVYIKLAFIMGGTWVFGFAANLTDFEPLWYIFIILNASQGTFLFIMFTFKRRVLSRLRNKVSKKGRTSSTRRVPIYSKLSTSDRCSDVQTTSC